MSFQEFEDSFVQLVWGSG